MICPSLFEAKFKQMTTTIPVQQVRKFLNQEIHKQSTMIQQQQQSYKKSWFAVAVLCGGVSVFMLVVNRYVKFLSIPPHSTTRQQTLGIGDVYVHDLRRMTARWIFILHAPPSFTQLKEDILKMEALQYNKYIYFLHLNCKVTFN